MSGRIERTLRLVEPDPVTGRFPRPVDARTHAQRLADTSALHREGNALFKGGHPPIDLRWEWRRVAAR